MVGGHVWQGGMHGRGACVAGETATAVDGFEFISISSCTKRPPLCITGKLEYNPGNLVLNLTSH